MVYYTVSMKNIAILHHDADFDGIASNEVCRYHLRKLHPDAAIHSYGWDYGRPVPSVFREPDSSFDWTDYDAIYIVDLSVDELMARPELRNKIVWIDHHKSAIEKWDKLADVGDKPYPYFDGLRIDGVAACRLCWHWFTNRNLNGVHYSFSGKEDFINRTVSEPSILTLLGEHDVWDHHDPNAELLQYGLRTCTAPHKAIAYHIASDEDVFDLVLSGEIARNYARTVDAQNTRAAYQRTLFNIPMIVLNGRGNSKTFDSALERFPEASALCMWYYDGNKVKVSLYHMRDRTDIDLSVFAKQMGGGGHRGACGFATSNPTWILDNLL